MKTSRCATLLDSITALSREAEGGIPGKKRGRGGETIFDVKERYGKRIRKKGKGKEQRIKYEKFELYVKQSKWVPSKGG